MTDEAAGPALSMEEFEREWITAHDALGILTPALGRDLAAKHLISRVKAGLFQLVAHTCVQTKMSDEVGRDHLALVHPVFIMSDLFGETSSFWVLGDFIHHGTGMHLANSVQLHFFGARFEPEGVRGMLPTNKAIVVESAGTEPELIGGRSLSDADLRAWLTLFQSAYGDDYTFDLALSSVRGMFPNHHIARDRLKAIVPARPIGRPKKGP